MILIGSLGAARAGAFAGARAQQLANKRTWTISGELSAGAFGEDGKGGFCSVGVGSRGVGCPLVRHLSLWFWPSVLNTNDMTYRFPCFKFCSPGLTTGYELDIVTTIGVGWVISPRLGLGFGRTARGIVSLIPLIPSSGSNC